MAHIENHDDHVEEAIQEYVDGGGTVPMPERLQAHLHECGACRQALEEYRLLDQAARQLPSPAAPESLFTGIMENIAALERKRRHGVLDMIAEALRCSVPAFALAMVAAVLLLTLCLIGSSPSPGVSMYGEDALRQPVMEYASQSLNGTVEALEGIPAYWRVLSSDLNGRVSWPWQLSSPGAPDTARVGWYAFTGLAIMVLFNITLIRRKEKGGHSSCTV